jgi:hypothetical protein
MPLLYALARSSIVKKRAPRVSLIHQLVHVWQRLDRPLSHHCVMP